MNGSNDKGQIEKTKCARVIMWYKTYMRQVACTPAISVMATQILAKPPDP